LAVALLIAAMLLCFLEVFIPSMGIITLIGIGCAAGSCYAAFQDGSGTGAAFIVLNVLGMGGSFAVAFKVLPKSPLAHKKTAVEESTYEPVESLAGLQGSSGVAFTDLRPGGTAVIKDRKVDVVAEGGYIDEGTKIKVLKIEGTKVVVTRETV
jgi:membrane-bound serine protease (ClpP class)